MKKFSSEYINYHDILKNAIIGFELEFYTDKPYFKLLELLNQELKPIKVHGFRVYHSAFKPDDKNFKIEADTSGGVDMVELVTGPINYIDARIILLKILKLMQSYVNTDEKCSIHINISFDKNKSEKTLEDLNPLKLILDVDEDKVFDKFPNRKNNFYAKSVKKLIPFKEYKYSTDAIELIMSNLELPNTKYYGINIKNYTEGRLEYRYIGGEDYQFKTSEILDLMDYFILLTWNSLDKKLEDEDIEKLLDYLNENISNFKKFTSLENFLGEFPTISLEVDRNNNFYSVKTYYDKLYEKLYEILMNTYNMKDAVINYDTEKNRLEIFDSFVKGIFDIEDLSFVECQVNEGTYNKCEFYECDLKNSHVENGSIYDTNVYNSKLSNCNVDKDCICEKVYFCGGFFDGEMKSGVFRGGKIGPNAVFADEVKMVTDDDNYFGKLADNSKKPSDKNMNDKKIL